jgi:hypothetical protein
MHNSLRRVNAQVRLLARMFCALALVAASASLVHAQAASADPPDEDDHAVVFELGWAGGWSHDEGWRAKGATFAFEVTPIENWLEVEVGAAAIRSDGVTEVPIDVLFKKPWQFSRQFEFMVGVGPELIHQTGPSPATYWGLSSVLDFMFWPKKNIGWYLEPGYEVTFHDGTQHGFAMAAGLLIGR